MTLHWIGRYTGAWNIIGFCDWAGSEKQKDLAFVWKAILRHNEMAFITA